MVAKLQKNANLLWKGLSAIKELNIVGEAATPVIHLNLKDDLKRKLSDDEITRLISEELIHSGYGIVNSKFASIDPHAKKTKMKPSLRVCASVDLTEAEIRKTIDQIREVTLMVLGRI